MSVPQVSSIPTQPTVQTALLLTKDLKSAVAEQGGIDNVPVTQLRTALVAAGVDVPADAGAGEVQALLKAAIDNGQKAVADQFEAAQVPSSVTESVVGALGFGQ